MQRFETHHKKVVGGDGREEWYKGRGGHNARWGEEWKGRGAYLDCIPSGKGGGGERVRVSLSQSVGDGPRSHRIASHTCRIASQTPGAASRFGQTAQSLKSQRGKAAGGNQQSRRATKSRDPQCWIAHQAGVAG